MNPDSLVLPNPSKELIDFVKSKDDSIGRTTL
jgi:hypothetical protein